MSFASNLSRDSRSLAIFVTEKYEYKDKNHILPKDLVQKIDSFLKTLKAKNNDEEINSLDVSDQKKCFVIRVKKKYENSYFEEIGGTFFTYIKKIKNINSVDIYADSLSENKDNLVRFFSEFIFGFSLKSYTFNKYKTLDTEKINKKVNFKIITSHKKKINPKKKQNILAIIPARGGSKGIPLKNLARLDGKSLLYYTVNASLKSKLITRTIVSTDNKKIKEESKQLGVEVIDRPKKLSDNKIGIVTGLAWTEFGGEILKIESAIMPGKGKMQITGKLGEVMQESVKAAKSYIRSKSLEFGIIPPIFEKKDFHIHVPEGATPKDGPSAGIAMVASIVSSITKIPVNKEIAMTGEVTVTGQVLPIGGLKEKLLAAHRAGIKQVLIPKDNEKDLVDIPQKVKDDIKITGVEIVDEVLKIALTKEFKKVEWTEIDNLTGSKSDDKSQAIIQ